MKILLFCTFVTEGGRAKAVPRDSKQRARVVHLDNVTQDDREALQ